MIFDLDGTLIDSADDVATTLNAVMQEQDLDPFSRPQVKALMGQGIRALIDKALRARAMPVSDERLDQLRDRFLELYCLNPVAATKVFPYAAELLAGLAEQRVAIGICTNKAEKPARLILQGLGLDRHIGAVIGGDSGFGQKPDPGPLLACAAKLGAPPDRVVYVGDHAVDVEAARAAGVPIVAVAFGYSLTPVGELGADRLIGCLSELPTVLASLI